MKVRAIKECPNQLSGSVFDIPETLACLFFQLGIAEPYEEPEPIPEPQPTPEPERQSRRRYSTRHLEAQND